MCIAELITSCNPKLYIARSSAKSASPPFVKWVNLGIQFPSWPRRTPPAPRRKLSSRKLPSTLSLMRPSGGGFQCFKIQDIYVLEPVGWQKVTNSSCNVWVFLSTSWIWLGCSWKILLFLQHQASHNSARNKSDTVPHAICLTQVVVSVREKKSLCPSIPKRNQCLVIKIFLFYFWKIRIWAFESKTNHCRQKKKRTGKNLILNPSKLDIYQEILRPPPPWHPIQSLKFFSQFVSSTKIMADADFYLPDDLWERICTFLNDEDGKDNNCYLKYVSLVSKKFPAITNSIRFSLTIRKETRPFLTPIFHRFPNLTSLDLSRFRGNYRVDRNTFLTEISCYPLNITLLNFANSALIPLNGLRAFSQNTTTLTSLNCSYKDSISTTD